MSACRCVSVDDFEGGVGFTDTRGCPIHADPEVKLRDTIIFAASVREMVETLQVDDSPLGPEGEAALYDCLLKAADAMENFARYALRRR